ncbi:hypothetical protein YB2330_005897 [Saitoella coloradoensis]
MEKAMPFDQLEVQAGVTLAEVREEILNVVEKTTEQQAVRQKCLREEPTIYPTLSLPFTSQTHRSRMILDPSEGSWFHRTAATIADYFRTPASTWATTPLPKPKAIATSLSHIAFHPSLPVLAVAHSSKGGGIYFYDLRTRQWFSYHLTPPNTTSLLTAITFSGTNKLAAGMRNGDVCIWTLDLDPEHKSKNHGYAERIQLLPTRFQDRIGAVSGLEFSPCGHWLAISTTSSGTWVHNTVMNETQLISLAPSSTLAWAPTSRFLAVGTARAVQLIPVAIAGPRLDVGARTKIPTKGQIGTIAWLSDGRTMLYSVLDDPHVSVVYINPSHTLTGKTIHRQLRMIETPKSDVTGGGVKSFAIDPTGKRMVINFSDPTSRPVLMCVNPAVATLSDALYSIAYPIGLINGPTTGLVDVKFASQFQKGAFAANVWGDLITFLPMYYLGKVESDW